MTGQHKVSIGVVVRIVEGKSRAKALLNPGVLKCEIINLSLTYGQILLHNQVRNKDQGQRSGSQIQIKDQI